MRAHAVLSIVAVVAGCDSDPVEPIVRKPLLTVDATTARVATTADAPLQYAVELADKGIRMPEGLFLGTKNRIATGSCPTESGVGIGVSPAINAVAPAHGGPASGGELRVVWNGPVIAKIDVDWTAAYTCPGPQEAHGTSTFTMFPNGRIVRHDVAFPSTTALAANASCGCGAGNFSFTSFWTFASARDVNPDGSSAVGGAPRGCAVYADGMIGVAWPDAATRLPAPNGLSVYVHDWVNDAAALPADRKELVSAIQLATEIEPTACGEVLADLDTGTVAIAGKPVLADPSGIYIDAEHHAEPILIDAVVKIPRGFTVSLAAGVNSVVTRQPALPGDWFFTQVDGDQTLFWFPDGLDTGQRIIIDPR